MPNKWKNIPQIFTLWQAPFQAKCPVSKFALFGTAQVDVVVSEIEDKLLYIQYKTTAYRSGIVLYQTI